MATPPSRPVANGQSASLGHVAIMPMSCDISDEIAGNYAFTRYGVAVQVLTPGNVVTWEKKVWQRGVYLPWRPLYARRLGRARRKAEKIAAALGASRVDHSLSTPTAQEVPDADAN